MVGIFSADVIDFRIKKLVDLLVHVKGLRGMVRGGHTGVVIDGNPKPTIAKRLHVIVTFKGRNHPRSAPCSCEIRRANLFQSICRSASL